MVACAFRLFMHSYIFGTPALWSGFRHCLPLASLNHVLCYVNEVIAYHYTEVRFQ